MKPSKTFSIVGDDISDGYHTFDELYDHRTTLFIALCREISSNPAYQTGQKAEVWRSRFHSDGYYFEDWFLLGIGREQQQQITYHVPLFRWRECEFADTLDRAPDFDGHTPADVLTRLQKL